MSTSRFHFQRELEEAIAEHRSLDSLVSDAAGLDDDQRRRWRRECRLDEAIDAWRRERTGPGRLAGRRRRRRLGPLLSAALAVGILLLFGAATTDDHRQRRNFAVVEAPLAAPRPASSSPTPVVTHLSLRPLDRAMASDSAAENRAVKRSGVSERARRLADAIEPVGQRVGALLEQVIDAVPGAAVLAEWTYDT